MGKKQQICLVLIIIFSIGGIYTALHLAEIHYKKPRFRLNLINAVPLMESFWDRTEIEKAVRDAEADEALPDMDEDYDPYAVYIDNETNPYKNTVQDDEETGFVAEEACDISEVLSCSIVDDSDYSEIFGIAISIYGLAGYLLLILGSLMCLTLGSMYNKKNVDSGGTGTAGNMNPLSLRKPNIFELMLYLACWFGFVFSAWLTWIEATVIHSFCPYCLGSAAAMVGSLICMLIAYGTYPITGFFKSGN